jgi:hypothetical protein
MSSHILDKFRECVVKDLSERIKNVNPNDMLVWSLDDFIQDQFDMMDAGSMSIKWFDWHKLVTECLESGDGYRYYRYDGDDTFEECDLERDDADYKEYYESKGDDYNPNPKYKVVCGDYYICQYLGDWEQIDSDCE